MKRLWNKARNRVRGRGNNHLCWPCEFKRCYLAAYQKTCPCCRSIHPK